MPISPSQISVNNQLFNQAILNAPRLDKKTLSYKGLHEFWVKAMLGNSVEKENFHNILKNMISDMYALYSSKNDTIDNTKFNEIYEQNVRNNINNLQVQGHLPSKKKGFISQELGILSLSLEELELYLNDLEQYTLLHPNEKITFSLTSFDAHTPLGLYFDITSKTWHTQNGIVLETYPQGREGATQIFNHLQKNNLTPFAFKACSLSPLSESNIKPLQAIVDSYIPKTVSKKIEHNQYSPLAMAVAYKDLLTVDKLIKEGANVNAKSKYHLTPLEIALKMRNKAITRSLINAGAIPSKPLQKSFMSHFWLAFEPIIYAGITIAILALGQPILAIIPAIFGALLTIRSVIEYKNERKYFQSQVAAFKKNELFINEALKTNKLAPSPIASIQPASEVMPINTPSNIEGSYSNEVKPTALKRN